MKIGKKTVGLLASGLLFAGVGVAQLAGAGSAAALPPGNCHKSWTNNSGTVFCQGADFRAIITCVQADGTPYTVYGPWVASGQESTARCNGTDWLNHVAYPSSSVSWEIDS
ncbi:hypothetical protein OG455_08085 [Kitasatospora sp. NBC_01287]|uniref:hypothetical protein n=1 Tax=Kitasatospora sp. NBC_01287 TaxID=2903573 RepID=UPI0022514A45|nr:hypothetical protein [Kitasatospora sp. NBC_01287]MCX4745481.1 hypothetical protein [Kitasatospora sp. NBC_01287]